MWMMNAFGATESAFTSGGETLIRNTGEPMASILPLARQKRAQQLFKAFDAGRAHSCILYHACAIYVVPPVLVRYMMCLVLAITAVLVQYVLCDPPKIRHCWPVPLSEYDSDGACCRPEHIHRYARVHNIVLKVRSIY